MKLQENRSHKPKIPIDRNLTWKEHGTCEGLTFCTRISSTEVHKNQIL